MKRFRHTDPEFASRIDEAAGASSLFDPVIEERTRAIVEAVRGRGDAALVEFTERFDGASLDPERLALTRAELLQAALVAGPELRAAIADAHRNIAAFARRSRRRNWESRNAHGARVGEKFDPFQRVGIYIPG